MDPAPSFLIVGASGHIGRHLFRLIGPKRVVATFHSTPIQGGLYFDATRMRLAETVLPGSHRFEAAFLLYGLTRIDDCARAPDATARVNVESMTRAIDDLVGAGVTPIYASSDAVFDGAKGAYTEDEAPKPILTYGKQKAAVESYLRDMPKPWIVARLSKVVGHGEDGTDILLDWIHKIEREEPIECATDLFFTPIYIDDAVRALVTLAERKLSGIYHVCGLRSMSRWELLQILIEEMRRYRPVNPRIVLRSIRDFEFAEPRPLDTSMSPAKRHCCKPTPRLSRLPLPATC